MRAQILAAPWTIAESGLYGASAFSAKHGQRAAQEEVQNDAERIGNEDRQQSPDQAVHAAAACVAIDISDQQNITAHHDSGKESAEDASP